MSEIQELYDNMSEIQELYDNFRKTHSAGEIEEMLIFHFLNSPTKEILLKRERDYGNETIKVEKTENGFIFSLKVAEEKYDKIMEMDKQRKISFINPKTFSNITYFLEPFGFDRPWRYGFFESCNPQTTSANL